MKYILNAMKVTTQNRSSSLIIYMIFQIADLDPKLQTWADLVSKLHMLQLTTQYTTIMITVIAIIIITT